MAPLIWIGAGIAVLVAGGYALDEAGDAAESGAKLAKWAVIGGGLYVSYTAMKSAGVLK